VSTGRELFSTMALGRMPDRIPFIPTIYEHAAHYIGSTPSQVAANGKLLVAGQLACYERYRQDLVSVGLDIYNIECEALGAEVEYWDNSDLPSVKQIVLEDPGDLHGLSVPDPEKAARMPMLLDATEQVHRAIGHEVIVNGAVVGPFTLAAILRGFENFIVDLLTDPEYAAALMEFAMNVGVAFARAFIDRGLGISINESWIAPPLLSPAMYQQHVFPVERQMIGRIKALGQDNVALISGGDTTPIAHLMAATGTSLLLADSNADQQRYVELCQENGIFVRASIAPSLVKTGSDSDLKAAVERVVTVCGGYSGFIFGCGIVSFDTDPGRVERLREFVNTTTRPNS
jgi:uroporphyrinogen decarboxylase